MAETSTSSTRGKRTRIFYGWWIVAVSVLADGLKHGSFNRGFTVYIPTIQLELGYSASAIGLADTLGRFIGGVQGPLVGYLTDRLGPRTMLAFGGITSGLGFVLLAFTSNYYFFLLIFVGLLSVGFRSGYNNASIAAVNNWFRRRRGLAMSIVSMGNGLGGSLTPLVGLLIFVVGWRNSMLISGLIIITVLVPISFLVRRSPESMGLLPDGDQPSPETGLTASGTTGVTSAGGEARPARRVPRSGPSSDLDFTAPEAMRTLSYWLVVLAAALRNVVHSGMSFMLAPVIIWYLAGGGRDQASSVPIAAVFVGLVAISTMAFNPMIGWLGDRWSKSRLSAGCMLSGALALVLLLPQSGGLGILAIFALLQALSESANSLNWAIMGDFFGRRSFATLRGWQHLPDQLVSMWTSWWMGLIFDHTGSYFSALLPLAGVYCLSALVYVFLPRPRLPTRLRAREEALASHPNIH